MTEKDLTNLRQWRQRYNDLFLESYANYEQWMAEAAEAHAKGEETAGSALPLASLGSLGVAQRDPQALVRAPDASYRTGYLVIAEILQAQPR